jgi:hypothetical protein
MAVVRATRYAATSGHIRSRGNHEMRVATPLVLAATAFFAPTADALIIGEPIGAAVVPFTDFVEDDPFGSRYQQVYDAGAFPGPINIDSLTFFRATPGIVDPGRFQIAFYLTHQPVNGLSTHADQNLGTMLGSLNSFVLSGEAPAELTFDVSDFVYDPALGNLLMDVGSSSLLTCDPIFDIFCFTPGTRASYQFQSGENPSTSHFFEFLELPEWAADPGGLVTRFNLVPTQVPEPPSWLLLLGGLLMAPFMSAASRDSVRGRG